MNGFEFHWEQIGINLVFSPLQVRREKISERMKFLQDLVPGCNKVNKIVHFVCEIYASDVLQLAVILNILANGSLSIQFVFWGGQKSTLGGILLP